MNPARWKTATDFPDLNEAHSQVRDAKRLVDQLLAELNGLDAYGRLYPALSANGLSDKADKVRSAYDTAESGLQDLLDYLDLAEAQLDRQKSMAKRVSGDLPDKVRRIMLWSDSELEDHMHEGYSGRGMFGKTSPFAFTTERYEADDSQITMLERLGFVSDSLGMGLVWYIK